MNTVRNTWKRRSRRRIGKYPDKEAPNEEGFQPVICGGAPVGGGRPPQPNLPGQQQRADPRLWWLTREYVAADMKRRKDRDFETQHEAVSFDMSKDLGLGSPRGCRGTCRTQASWARYVEEMKLLLGEGADVRVEKHRKGTSKHQGKHISLYAMSYTREAAVT